MKTCPLCGSPRHRTLSLRGGHHLLARCQECDFVFSIVVPGPAEIHKRYQSGYYQSWGLHDPAFEPVLREMKLHTFRGHMTRVARLMPSGAVLDVGCATGFFLEMAEEAGWDVWGVELSEEGASRARRRFGDRVFCGSLAEAKFPSSRFDLVTLFDVIEHVADPRGLVDEVSRILRPGGLLLLTTPDIGSLSARLMGKYWIHFTENEHLCFFDRQRIKRFMRDHGFSLELVTSAVKVFNLKYVAFQFQQHRVPLLSWTVSLLKNIFPDGWSDRNFPAISGDMLVIARKIKE